MPHGENMSVIIICKIFISKGMEGGRGGLTVFIFSKPFFVNIAFFMVKYGLVIFWCVGYCTDQLLNVVHTSQNVASLVL